MNNMVFRVPARMKVLYSKRLSDKGYDRVERILRHDLYLRLRQFFFIKLKPARTTKKRHECAEYVCNCILKNLEKHEYSTQSLIEKYWTEFVFRDSETELLHCAYIEVSPDGSGGTILTMNLFANPYLD